MNASGAWIYWSVSDFAAADRDVPKFAWKDLPERVRYVSLQLPDGTTAGALCTYLETAVGAGRDVPLATAKSRQWAPGSIQQFANELHSDAWHEGRIVALVSWEAPGLLLFAEDDGTAVGVYAWTEGGEQALSSLLLVTSAEPA